MVQIRQMFMSDADFMLELKNYEETRKFAIFSHDEVKREDHIKFLEKNLDQFMVIIKIVIKIDKNMAAEERLGVYRINGQEVSIWVHRDHRGKQIALKTLNQISWTGMLARIVDGNVASMRTFVKAGFIPKEHKDNYYILEKP